MRLIRTTEHLLCIAALLAGCGGNRGSQLVVEDQNVNIVTSALTVVNQPNLKLTLIASVTPPIVASTVIQANGFWLASNAAYISYNNQGMPIVGGIDVVDLSTPTAPKLISEKLFDNTKINALTVADGNLYYVGAKNPGGAVLGKISLSNNLLGVEVASSPLPSYAGTGIAAGNGVIYATSGDAGGLGLFDTNLKAGATADLPDARGVAVSPDGKTVGVISGQPGTATFFDASGAPVASDTLSGATIPESKSTIQLGSHSTLVSLSDGGLALVCTQNGTIVASQAAELESDLSANLTVTNAASAGSGLVFAASGGAGVSVYQLTTGSLISGTNCTKDTLSLLGHLDLGDHFSANMVYFRNGYLFVADGLGGFKIISVVQSASASGGDNDFINPGTGLVVLDPTAKGSLSLSGNGSLLVRNGAVYVDSNSSTALSANGNAQATADAFFITGNKSLNGNASLIGTVTTGAAALADPLAYLPVPTTTGLTVQATSRVTVSGNDTKTLSPGVYNEGIILSGNASVTLQPGVYYLSSVGLSVTGNANITGTGVFIYNASTSAGISLTGNGNVTLTPMTTGTYAGITIFQNRTSTQAVSISGNGVISIHGTLYMAAAPLTLSGNGSLPTLGSLDVADTITISGNGTAVVSQ